MLGKSKNVLPYGAVAYVILPPDISREAYVHQCYLNDTVSIQMETGDAYHNVPVSAGLFNYIEFPQNAEQLGSPVIFANIWPHEKPAVIAVLYKKDDGSPVDNEGIFSLFRQTSTGQVSVQGDGRAGRLILEAVGQTEGGELVVKIANTSGTAYAYFLVQGELRLDVLKDVLINTAKGFVITVSDPTQQENVPTVIKYERNVGLTVKDEFGSTVLIQDGLIRIRLKDDNRVVEISKDGGISLGTEGGSAEPGVLGTTLKELLGKLIDAIAQITVPTAMGPSGTPINASQITAIKQELDDMLSEHVTLD